MNKIARNPIPGLLQDLQDERQEVIDLLRHLPETAWDIETPAEGWTVRDQVTHLLFFDTMTTLAIATPVQFEELRDQINDLQEFVDGAGEKFLGVPPSSLLASWMTGALQLHVAASNVDPKTRVPWFGPSMSPASKLTARLMETWAHGQDIHDAVGETREPTDRLRNVAQIGVLSILNSFRARGLADPTDPVSVQLTAPNGNMWAWGDPDAEDTVTGAALDFCLVVTQRRHPDDVNLVATGTTAKAWIDIAQAFAGPPGAGRQSGQFN